VTLYAGYAHAFDLLSVEEASIIVREALKSFQALPVLRSVTLALNWQGDYITNSMPTYGDATKFFLDITRLHHLPPVLRILHIEESLVSAEDFLDFLDSSHLPPALTFIQVDLHTVMFHSSKIKAVLHRLHSLGIRFEIATFEVYLKDEDEDEDGHTIRATRETRSKARDRS
jgi:hypothetical protein